ncbi:MAG: hypothetical protein LBM19_00235 [Holosporales bacterium]|jgi:hypothetical protein|nr:hypothetical protein [Holosporales bacterium]
MKILLKTICVAAATAGINIGNTTSVKFGVDVSGAWTYVKVKSTTKESGKSSSKHTYKTNLYQFTGSPYLLYKDACLLCDFTIGRQKTKGEKGSLLLELFPAFEYLPFDLGFVKLGATAGDIIHFNKISNGNKRSMRLAYNQFLIGPTAVFNLTNYTFLRLEGRWNFTHENKNICVKRNKNFPSIGIKLIQNLGNSGVYVAAKYQHNFKHTHDKTKSTSKTKSSVDIYELRLGYRW